MDGSWHETATVITGMLTAGFTGLGAWLVWRQQRERITVEWDFAYSSPAGQSSTLEVTGRVRNQTSSTLKAWLLKVRRHALSVTVGSNPKPESWAANQAFVRCEPSPGESATFSAIVVLDWQQLHRQQQQWPARLRTWFARVAWRSLSWRVHHGASLHFQITIDSKSNRRFRRVIVETMNITPEMIAKQIATINKEPIR